MKTIQFPSPYRHEHPPVRDVNDIFEEKKTLGQAGADLLARVAGSWTFILIQSAGLLVWAAVNVIAITWRWDPYPFILLNLVLSLQAAYAAPIIMMSQNRQAERDRLEAHNDYLINQKAEEEVRVVLEHLAAQDRALEELRHAIEGANRRAPDGATP